MADKNAKLGTLQQQGTLNPDPKLVRDELFLQDDFFDPRDLIQVKYDLLRRVQTEGQSVTDASANFGFSRPSFYQALSAFEQDGLAGLVPHKRGPKQAHKLTEEVLAFHRRDAPERTIRSVAGSGEADSGSLRYPGSSAKHRTQLAAPSKKTPLTERHGSTPARHDLVAEYEHLRRDAIATVAHRGEGLGWALFVRRGMTTWMQAWSECAPHSEPSPRSRSRYQ